MTRIVTTIGDNEITMAPHEARALFEDLFTLFAGGEEEPDCESQDEIHQDVVEEL